MTKARKNPPTLPEYRPTAAERRRFVAAVRRGRRDIAAGRYVQVKDALAFVKSL